MGFEVGRGCVDGVEGGEEERRGEGREADEEDEGVERREKDSREDWKRNGRREEELASGSWIAVRLI